MLWNVHMCLSILLEVSYWFNLSCDMYICVWYGIWGILLIIFDLWMHLSVRLCWKYYVDYTLGIGVYMPCEVVWGVLSIIPMLIYAHGFGRYCWRYHTELYLCYECVWCVQMGGLCRSHICCVSKCVRCIVGSSMILLMLNAGCRVSALCYLLDYPVNPYSYQWVIHYDVDRFEDEFDLFTRLFIPLAAHSDMWLSDLVQPLVG